jgi:hypothetical protein
MSNDVRDWIGFAIGVVSLLLTIVSLWARPHRRTRRVERSRSFKAWGVEWTTHDREDDIQS